MLDAPLLVQITAKSFQPFTKVKNMRELFNQLYERGMLQALPTTPPIPGSRRCTWQGPYHYQCTVQDDTITKPKRSAKPLCRYHRHVSDIRKRAAFLLWAFKQHPLDQIAEVVLGSTPRERTDFLASCLFADPSAGERSVVVEEAEDEVIVIDD